MHRTENARVVRATPKIPISKLHAHRNLHSSARSSALRKDRIDIGHVRLVVENEAVEFHPGVRDERQLLTTDHQLGRESMLFQKAGGGRRPLQTKDLAEVQDGRQVDRLAYLRASKRVPLSRADRSSSNAIVDGSKVFSEQRKFKAEKFPTGLQPD
jgi:hypothetical protein